jgi:hypothetical protein
MPWYACPTDKDESNILEEEEGGCSILKILFLLTLGHFIFR